MFETDTTLSILELMLFFSSLIPIMVLIVSLFNLLALIMRFYIVSCTIDNDCILDLLCILSLNLDWGGDKN